MRLVKHNTLDNAYPLKTLNTFYCIKINDSLLCIENHDTFYFYNEKHKVVKVVQMVELCYNYNKKYDDINWYIINDVIYTLESGNQYKCLDEFILKNFDNL